MLRAALAAGDGCDGRSRARLLSQLAMEVIYSGDLQTRLGLSDEAVAMARRLRDPATLVTVLYQRSVTLWGVHGLEQRCRAVAEAEPLLDGLADPSLAFHISHQGAHTALATGDMALADRRLEAMHDHAATCGQPTLAVVRGRRAIQARAVRRARRGGRAHRVRGDAGRDGDGPARRVAVVLRPRYSRSGLVEGRRRPRMTTTSSRPSSRRSRRCARSSRRSSPACRRRTATIATPARRSPDSRATDSSTCRSTSRWLATVAIAGYACWQTGDAANAEIVAAALAPWAEHFVDMGPTWLGSTSLYLGLLAVTLERPREAQRTSRARPRCTSAAARGRFRRIPALAWAELVAGGGLGGTDVPEPQALAGEALAVARELALPGVEARARRVLAGLGG